MDVGHVILGRLWLYDKDVTIFSRSNMCQFEHGGNKIKLLPCPPKTEQEEQKSVAMKKINSVSLISEKTFSQDVKKGAPFVVLSSREVNKEPSNLIPPEVYHPCDYRVC